MLLTLHRQVIVLHIRSRLRAALADLERRREPEPKGHHDEEHERGVKDVQGPLVTERVPVAAEDVLDKTEDGTDHDARADSVEHPQARLPGRVARQRRLGRVLCEARMEDDGGDPEDCKQDNLDDETGDNKVLAHLLTAVLDHETATAGLDEEGEAVAGDEDTGEPVDADHRQGLAVDAADDATKGHVD